MPSGQTLGGELALTRSRLGGDDRSWILITLADEYTADSRAATPTRDDNRAVLSGITNEDLAAKSLVNEEAVGAATPGSGYSAVMGSGAARATGSTSRSEATRISRSFLGPEMINESA